MSVGINVKGIFEDFLSNNRIFKERKVLQDSYFPEVISHRDDQIKEITSILSPILKEERPSNLFIYGKPGTGKTLSVKYVTKNLIEVADSVNVPLRVFYLNCKMKKIADTEYRLFAQLIKMFGGNVPSTGLPTDEIYNIFFKVVDQKKQGVLLILDEIDHLVNKIGDEILYNLTRINTELLNAQVSIIGISNSITFVNNIDPRIKSSLSEEEVLFPPYNAMQIQDILKIRAKSAFLRSVVGPGVIEKCAAYAAREHGDVRRAISLLRVAAEIAERNRIDRLSVKFIDEAEEKIEKDKVIEIIKIQAKHFKVLLLGIINLIKRTKPNTPIFTGDIYDCYRDVCNNVRVGALTQRRVSDLISEMDILGIVKAKTISKGRYGRTREVYLTLPSSLILKIENSLLSELDIR